MTIAQLLAIPLAASAVTFLYADAAAANSTSADARRYAEHSVELSPR